VVSVKKILSEDTANAESNRGEREVPRAPIYLPNYREVNHLLTEAPGSASISFNEVLSKASLNMLINQEKIYEGIERDSLMTDVNTQYQKKLDEFKSSDPSGRGYTEFATRTWSQLTDAAAAAAQSSEVAQQIRALGQSNMKGIANSSVQTENQMTTAYALAEKQKTLEIKYNLIRNDPDRFEGLSAETIAAASDLEGVIPASAYKKFLNHTMQNLYMSYGMGLTKKNPLQAEEFLKSDLFVNNLSGEKYESLKRYAEQNKKDTERREYREEKLVLMQKNSDSKLERYDVDIGIERNTVGIADIEANDNLTTEDKKQCIKNWIKKNRNEELKFKAYEKMNLIWEHGGDISSVEEKYQKSRYEEMVRAKQAQAEGEESVTGKKITVTSTDKALIAKIFSYTNTDLRNELQSKITQTENVDDRINAAFAVKYLMSESPRTLGEIGNKYISFVNETVSRTATDPANKASIVERAAATYLDESKSEENKIKERRIRQIMRAGSVNPERFADNYGFNGSFWNRLTVEDKAQFEKDMYYEIRNAVVSGADTISRARDIAAERMKDYWKISDGKYMRNPPQLMNPMISEYALNNFTASAVKKAVSRLKKISYAGPQFELPDEVIRNPAKPTDFYTQNLTLHKKPLVSIKVGDEVYNKEVNLESIPGHDGLYKMYCDTDDGSKYYIPSANNPLLHATIRIGTSE
jgi:hypothetical protein